MMFKSFLSSRVGRLLGSTALVVGTIAACTTPMTAESSDLSTNEPSTEVTQAETNSSQWRRLTGEEVDAQWDNILISPLAIAALNQLAIEGFIAYDCEKSFYENVEFGGFQTMLRVQCPTERGVSAAVGYDEMRVIFNRFESNIESFDIQRVGPEQEPEINLPD
ncbi:MAG: hypothetical protein ACTS2F_13860 [Thainema sp.]